MSTQEKLEVENIKEHLKSPFAAAKRAPLAIYGFIDPTEWRMEDENETR